MSDQHQIELDLADYLAKESNMRREDRMKALRAIFDKHYTFSKLGHLITHSDVNLIASLAKARYVEQTLPMMISKKQVPHDELRIVAVIEAVLGYFNLHFLSKKEVKIDYTESK